MKVIENFEKRNFNTRFGPPVDEVIQEYGDESDYLNYIMAFQILCGIREANNPKLYKASQHNNQDDLNSNGQVGRMIILMKEVTKS